MSLDFAPAAATPRIGVARRLAATRAAAADLRPHACLVAAYGAAAIAVSVATGVPLGFSVAGYFDIVWRMVAVVAALALLAMFLKIAFKERSDHPTRRMVEELRRLLTPERAVNAVLLLAAIGLLQTFFAFFKPLIPRFQPFALDPLIAKADRALFLGHDAWQAFWPLFGNPVAAFLLNIVYNLWFFWMILVWVLVAFAERHTHENRRYFLAEILVWTVGGTALAILFSSAGPCYYGLVVPGADPFAPLMAKLAAFDQQIPLFALKTQALLWDGYAHPGPDKIAGISAMPSMHCATALIRTRIAYVHNRKLGHASAAATAMIFIGSIVLGWHYALDGLAGFALGLALWWLAARLMPAIRAPQGSA